MAVERGVGKCKNSHSGSYGYPTRPDEPYAFCPLCGNGMVWSCSQCGRSLPEDSTELEAARFCMHCGAAYFENGDAEN